MKKMKMYAAMAATTLAVAGAAVPAQAAGGKLIQTEINGRTCYVYVVAGPNGCVPDLPEIPGTPVIPEEPEAPETPDAPEEPVAPSVPEQPEEPEEPAVPVVPGQPEEPEAPATPEVPETPVTPEQPDVPAEPEQPELPDTPEEDSSYEDQIVGLVNEERAKAGLPALTVDTGLEAAGLVRAKEIVSNFSHTRPDGTSFSTAIREQNVSFRGAGENIAWGQRTPEEVMDGWMNSPGHRANILNENFTRIGVGHYQNGAGTNYWVQLFAY